jgi:transmembrane sensor
MSADQTDAPGGGDERAREAAIAHFAARRGGRPVALPGDPQTQAALAEVEALWASLDHMADDKAVAAMRAQALARIAEPAAETGAGRQRRRWPAIAAGLGVAAAGLGLVLAVRPGHAPQSITLAPSAPQLALRTLENGAAGPRTVALADGSQITLDAHTRVLLGADGAPRRAVLAEGRAFFRVTHDGARPFRVEAGDLVVTDIGTVFEVSRAGDGVAVALLEGAVDVAAPGLAARRLAPGQRLTLRGREAALGQAEAIGTPGWQDGMIVADAEPLASLVDRFNRYLARPLVLRDARAAAVPVSGAFRVDDPQALVDAMGAMGHPGALAQGPARP